MTKPFDPKKLSDEQLKDLLQILLNTVRNPAVRESQRAEINPIIEQVAMEIGLRIDAQIS